MKKLIIAIIAAVSVLTVAEARPCHTVVPQKATTIAKVQKVNKPIHKHMRKFMHKKTKHSKRVLASTVKHGKYMQNKQKHFKFIGLKKKMHRRNFTKMHMHMHKVPHYSHNVSKH